MDWRKIERALCRPAPFAGSTHPFWTDPYISQRMLEAHLNPEWGAASRRSATIDTTVSWMKGGYFHGRETILDLGCGPGLYTERFHDLGLKVTGIDYSERSLAYAAASARQKRKEITYLRRDYLATEIPGRYDLITMIYCDFGVLPNEERDPLLAKIRGALTDDGLFIFDVFTEALADTRQEGRDWHAAESGFFAGEPHLELSQVVHFPEQQLFGSQYTIVMENEIRIYRTWDRYYHAGDIRAFLEKAGFEVVELNYDLIAESNFGPADVVFAIAKKRDVK